MEYNKDNKEIISDKIINELDKLVINFVNILEEFTDYVIVSGYVAIILGRSRATEDIDFLIPKMSLPKFEKLFNSLKDKGYECANTLDAEDAYSMLNEHAIRFFNITPVPNMEFKIITNNIQKEAFDKKIKIRLKEKILFISPLELQIVYKLSLIARDDFEEISSDKDFEDAKHLYETFKEKLDKEKLLNYIKLFKIEDIWEFLENEKL